MINKKRFFVFLFGLLATFVLLRIYLYFSPNSNFIVASYNIHHLFTGLLLIVVGGVPLAIFSGSNFFLDLATFIFSIGLSMSLDEWVYLIATDGSDSAYLLPISFWGSMIMIGLTCVYALGLYFLKKSAKKK